MRTIRRTWVAWLTCVVPVLWASGEAVAQAPLHAISGQAPPHKLLQLEASSGAILESVAITDAELLRALTIDASGRFLSTDRFQNADGPDLFEVDPATGAGSTIGPIGQGWNFRSLEYDASTGVLYGATDGCVNTPELTCVINGSVLYRMDPATGAATPVAGITGLVGQAPTALAIDSRGNAYITGIGWDLYALDLDTGAATRLGTLDTPTGSPPYYRDLAFDESDVLYGVRQFGSSGRQSAVDRIDIATLATTELFATELLDPSDEQPIAIAFASGPRDADGDGVPDREDNCIDDANATQLDADRDGYGDACDPDYNDDGSVGISDFNRFRPQFGLTDADPGFDPAVDHDGDGSVGIPDFNVFRSFFGGPP
ncbi:MAG: hypothetical protein QNK03_09255, partial [Myxococcota bacterium]|nr:hypothetical protein [Myxococcota bacterium]